eukprot:986068-Pleurochrysis_carterae.AAC.4
MAVSTWEGVAFIAEFTSSSAISITVSRPCFPRSARISMQGYPAPWYEWVEHRCWASGASWRRQASSKCAYGCGRQWKSPPSYQHCDTSRLGKREASGVVGAERLPTSSP